MANKPINKVHASLIGARQIALIANGAIHDYPFITRLLRTYERYIAVDGGLIHCHQMHIRPHLIIGDFDSIPAELLHLYEDVPLEKHSVDKDQSDMELAIVAGKIPTAEKIGMFGALEKRTDHTLGNLHLMCRDPHILTIETERETLFAIPKHSKRIVACQPGQTVSLIPLGDVTNVTTRGLKWELTAATLNCSWMSLSNVCLENTFEITIGQGHLICCLLRDEKQVPFISTLQ